MIIGFIGVGKMATAIINGLNTSSHRIIISGSSLARSRQIAEELEVEAAASHQELLDKADLVILGIKPQMFDKVLTDLNFHQPIMSMAAGVTLERLASLTSPDLPLIRIMPNLNALILKSTTGLCTNDKVSEDLLAIAKEITDSFGTTCQKVEFLLNDAITRQLVSDVPLCTFLSGGLDSSIISKFASNYCKNNGLPPLDTYSIDYVDNDKNFVKSDFQPNSDNYYINLMNKNLYTNHHSIVIDTPELASYLEDAMIARDIPGMADIDSSLLLFCKNVKKEMTVALTGECADEIFGGYPWFFREDALNSNTFPWSIAINERQQLLNPLISNKVNLKDYIDFRYNESLKEVEILDTDSKQTAEKRKISHLTLNWFMQTLLDRSDRMAMYNGLELRVPFCDYRLAEYVWNIPWEIKALNGREKGLLRYVCRNFLPDEIVDRKKSPYPKTHNPTYLAKVKGMLTNIMQDKNAPINNLLNRQYILDILNTDGTAFTRPWFGQLMTGPQLMAYLCQVNMWLEKYEPKIEL